MKEIINPDMDFTVESKFDRIIESLLVILLVFMPFALGVVFAWSEEVVVALSLAMGLVFLLKLILDKHATFIWSWAYIPVGLFVLIAIFQLIPLPAGLVASISPNTASIKGELLGDLPNSDNLLNSMTLSFYPNATRHDLRLVLSLVIIFVVVLNVYRRPEQIKRLLGAIAVIGGAVALL
ncbi:MAG: hypothetical protein ACYS17_16905, partial [Planctomycetota bacterium]